VSAAWVVRDSDGVEIGAARDRRQALYNADMGNDHEAYRELREGSNGPYNGFTVTRETLLTPAHAAVIAAAKAWAASAPEDGPHECERLLNAVAALRTTNLTEALK
jgi:hypothetical protein